MPRIYSSDAYPWDFCQECWPDSEEDAKFFHPFLAGGTGPDGRGDCFSYNAEHPNYDLSQYECCICHKDLTAEDN